VMVGVAGANLTLNSMGLAVCKIDGQWKILSLTWTSY